MSKIKVPTSFNIELEFTLPDFHKRLFAWMVDMAILIAYLFMVAWLRDSRTSGGYTDSAYNAWALDLIFLTPVLLYHLLCETLMNGQSIGKKIFHLRVISEDGGSPSLYQYLLRWLMRAVDFSLTGCLGGLISTMSTAKNQRLGDIAAGTLLIVTKTSSELSDTIFQELEEDYQPRYAHAVLRLSDRDLNMIKTILENCRRSGNYQLAGRTSTRIRTALSIDEYQDDMDFLETILKDYNYVAGRN